MELRPLRESDDRSAFTSGDEDLDRFFHRYAAQNQFRHHLGVTWVAVEEDRIVGFATVAPAQLDTEDLRIALRRRLPGYPLPVLRLARLAVAPSDRGRGVGTALLRRVFELAVEMSEGFGCVGVVVDAKPGSVGFCRDLGFSELEVTSGALDTRPLPTAMFLPLALVERTRPTGSAS